MALQIDEDTGVQKVMWTTERIGWILMLLFLIAALLGYLGSGPLSKRIAGKENSEFWIEYERFERHSSSNKIKFHITPKENKDNKIKLVINKDFINEIELHSVEPQPEKVEASSDGYHYTFNIIKSGELTIIFKYEPDSYGSLYLKAALNEKTY